MGEFFLHAAGGVFAGKFRCAKFARGKIKSGEANAIADPGERAQEVVFFGSKRGIGGSAGRDDACHLAAYQLLGDFRILHLFTNRHLESLADQFRDVAVSGVIGNTAHGNGDTFFLVARGEGDLQFARSGDRVVEEELVKVTQPEEQERVGMLFLDGGVLPHQRRGSFIHRAAVIGGL